jgi:hypothetical protein
VVKGKFVVRIYTIKSYETMTHRCRAFQQKFLYKKLLHKFSLANQTSPMARFL